jgi:hypothetical protein
MQVTQCRRTSLPTRQSDLLVESIYWPTNRIRHGFILTPPWDLKIIKTMLSLTKKKEKLYEPAVPFF